MSQETLPVLSDDTLTHWPPKAHIIRKKDEPAKEGTIALCGAKLMGMDLKGDVLRATCEKCLEVVKRELRGGK